MMKKIFVSAVFSTVLSVSAESDLQQRCQARCNANSLRAGAREECDSYTGQGEIHAICLESAMQSHEIGCAYGCDAANTCFGYGNSQPVRQIIERFCRGYKINRSKESVCTSEFSRGATSSCAASARWLADETAVLEERSRAERARLEAEELARAEAELVAAHEAQKNAERAAERQKALAEEQRKREEAAAAAARAAAEAEAARKAEEEHTKLRAAKAAEERAAAEAKARAEAEAAAEAARIKAEQEAAAAAAAAEAARVQAEAEAAAAAQRAAEKAAAQAAAQKQPATAE